MAGPITLQICPATPDNYNRFVEQAKELGVYPGACREQILCDFGEPVLRDIARILVRAYAEARRASLDRYVDSVARDHYPIERRSMIEDAFARFGDRHPHVRSAPTQNKRDTYGHVRLLAKRSVLTQSKTEGEMCLPREAEFRGTLAKHPQRALEGFGEPELVEEEPGALYGVVVHGPDERDVARVAFMRILIPDPTGKLVVDHFDLSPYGGDGRGHVNFPAAPIAPATPRLKTIPKTAEEGSGA